MVVPLGQIAQFPIEPLVARVVLSGPAIAIASPVTEGFHDFVEVAIVGEDRSALAHRNVMGRIEA
jgi:hypothetical protein